MRSAYGENSPGSRRNRIWPLGLALVVATIFAYQPAWKAGFIWDDDDYVTNNLLLSAPDGLSRIWFSTDSPSQYFPLVYTTFRAEHALWGLNPAGYHWVNILLHAVNGLLVWRLLGQLRVPGAWLAAAIFALHPVQVESVAWISELKNVQSLFFCLLALLAWIAFVDTRPAWRIYALTLAAYALALFSKTTACTLPAALLLILWLKEKRIDAARLMQVVPFVAMGLAMGIVSMWWERHHQGTVGPGYALSLLERLLVASRALWFYAGNLLWPVDLTFNYPLWSIDPAKPSAYGWLVSGTGLAVAVFFARRSVRRSVGIAMLFYTATLSPLLGFVMLYTFRYTFVADHYQYVAIIAPVTLAAATLSTWVRNPFVRRTMTAVLLVGLGAATWRQSRMYRDLETLWRTTIERNPTSYMGHNNLGAVYLEQDRVDEAIARFEQCLSIRPDHTNAHYNLGRALLRAGRVDEAIAHLEAVLEAEPHDAKAHSDLGLALLLTGQPDKAIAHTEIAVGLQPAYADAQNNLGAALLQAGRIDEALVHLRQALAIQPIFADACYNLGTALLRQGRAEEAIGPSQKALEIRPNFARAHNNLGMALFHTGQADNAIAHFQHALQIEPANGEARKNLGLALFQIGRSDDAFAHFRTILAAQPDSADAHCDLAGALFQVGQLDEALAHFQRAAEIQPDNPEILNNFGWVLLQAGQAEEAIARFQLVLKLQPEAALARHNLAMALLQQGRVRDAIAHYESLLKADPASAPTLAALAWVLATWPEPSIRQSAQAIELAQQANQLTGAGDPLVLRSLAAAYADGGRFAEAVIVAQQAFELAGAQSNGTLAASLRPQIELYRSGVPFRVSVPILQDEPGT